MPLRMCPRRCLVSLSPHLSFDVAVQTSFHSVHTSSLDAAVQAIPHRSWPTLAKPTLAKPTLAKPTLANGQSCLDRLWPNRLWQFQCFRVLANFCCCCCGVVLLCPTPKDTNPKPCLGRGGRPSRPTCSGFGVVVVVVVVVVAGLDFPGPPSAGPPLHWTPPPPDRPKFRSFSSLSRHRFALSVSLWVSSR